ncbi:MULTISPECIES: hypothetical protein [unclassified Caballeronia]|uniref:hypothetical protein n=1 Tax=unclassified Caballeronia TaxID=2646786 RepID=UPI0028550697|nr:MULTISPECIES: hypothetical protein [unclassified Caballeronia]MDR5772900.1 hypothetical protein [Caballeronia sp. LZ002]MDR5803637.1 hypothetical protein [Caballeronia sp. LZ001]MDR5848334.1 hypothetical protein [Caballeronia sp. LZ003]
MPAANLTLFYGENFPLGVAMRLNQAIKVLYIVAILVTSAAQAEVPAYKTKLIDGVLVGYLPKTVLKKIPMERVADGSFKIKPHSRPPELNELHRRYCANLGAEDMTDEADVFVSLKDSDAVLCTTGASPDANLSGRPAAVKSISTPDDIIGYPIGTAMQINQVPEADLNRRPSANLEQVLINLRAPSGITPMNRNYTASGIAEYTNMPKSGQTTSILTIEEESPLVVRAIHVSGPNYSKDTLTGVVLATRPVAISSVTGCYTDQCAQKAHGSFRHF